MQCDLIFNINRGHFGAYLTHNTRIEGGISYLHSEWNDTGMPAVVLCTNMNETFIDFLFDEYHQDLFNCVDVDSFATDNWDDDTVNILYKRVMNIIDDITEEELIHWKLTHA